MGALFKAVGGRAEGWQEARRTRLGGAAVRACCLAVGGEEREERKVPTNSEGREERRQGENL